MEACAVKQLFILLLLLIGIQFSPAQDRYLLTADKLINFHFEEHTEATVNLVVTLGAREQPRAVPILGHEQDL